MEDFLLWNNMPIVDGLTWFPKLLLCWAFLLLLRPPPFKLQRRVVLILCSHRGVKRPVPQAFQCTFQLHQLIQFDSSVIWQRLLVDLLLHQIPQLQLLRLTTFCQQLWPDCRSWVSKWSFREFVLTLMEHQTWPLLQVTTDVSATGCVLPFGYIHKFAMRISFELQVAININWTRASRHFLLA